MNKKVIIGFILVLIAVVSIAAGIFLIMKKEGSKTNPGNTAAVTTGQSAALNEQNDSVAEVQIKKKNVVLVLDASGSMADKVEGQSKINVAKEAAGKFIDSIAGNNINLSIVVYGHKGNGTQAQKTLSCQGIEEIYYLGPLNPAVAKSKIAGFNANGWTPIADSLKKASETLAPYSSDQYENSVVLLSDGEETCGGDPATKAEELCRSNTKVITDVIGFSVTGAAEDQLKKIAQSGCGKYYSVNNIQEIDSAFINIESGIINIQRGDRSIKVDESGNIEMKNDDREADINSDGTSTYTKDGTTVTVDKNGNVIDIKY